MTTKSFDEEQVTTKSFDEEMAIGENLSARISAFAEEMDNTAMRFRLERLCLRIDDCSDDVHERAHLMMERRFPCEYAKLMDSLNCSKPDLISQSL